VLAVVQKKKTKQFFMSFTEKRVDQNNTTRKELKRIFQTSLMSAMSSKKT
jgi:hypothetical protein